MSEQKWAHSPTVSVSRDRFKISCICGFQTTFSDTKEKALEKYRVHTGLVERGRGPKTVSPY